MFCDALNQFVRRISKVDASVLVGAFWTTEPYEQYGGRVQNAKPVQMRCFWNMYIIDQKRYEYAPSMHRAHTLD